MTRLLAALACLSLISLAKAGLKQDIEFGKAGDVSLMLDAFTPEGDGPFPTCILVHGGGWTKGDKTTFIKPLFDPLSRHSSSSMATRTPACRWNRAISSASK